MFIPLYFCADINGFQNTPLFIKTSARSCLQNALTKVTNKMSIAYAHLYG